MPLDLLEIWHISGAVHPAPRDLPLLQNEEELGPHLPQVCQVAPPEPSTAFLPVPSAHHICGPTKSSPPGFGQGGCPPHQEVDTGWGGALRLWGSIFTPHSNHVTLTPIPVLSFVVPCIYLGSGFSNSSP